MSVSEWRIRFQATPAEVLDLLDVTRVRNRSLLRNLVETGTAHVKPQMAGRHLPLDLSGPLSLAPLPNEPQPSPIAIYCGSVAICTIPPSAHTDVVAIMDTGLELALKIDTSTAPQVLQIALATQVEKLPSDKKEQWRP